MKKAFLEKILAIGMVIAVFMTGNMYAYAGYHETTSNHTYAGDTRFLYMLKMDDFSAYAYLDADDESEISLIGYVTDSLGYDDAYANKYTFSASDQHGYSIGAGRQVAYITVESYARYFVCSDTGSTYANLSLHDVACTFKAMYKPYIILERCFYVKKENFNNNYWGCNLCGFIISCFDNGEGKEGKVNKLRQEQRRKR